MQQSRASADAAPDRVQQLTENLQAVHRRIDAAMAETDRTTRPELIVITKNFPASDVEALAGLGVRDVGENKDQEASAKSADIQGRNDLRWHFVGQLQSNKAKSVVRYAHWVHSVDRLKLVRALDRAAGEHRETGGPVVQCLIQVDLRDPIPQDSRGGAAPEQVPALAEAIAAAEHLRLAGVMAVAPLGQPARPAFERLAEISQQLTAQYPGATAISAGMSHDLEEAVACGATHLRVGRDVLGARSYDR